MLQIWVAPGGGSDMPDRNKRSICSTCYHHVGDTADSCPSCGASIKVAKRDTFGFLALVGFWAFNVLIAIWCWRRNYISASTGNGNIDPLSGFWPEIATSQLLVSWLLGATLLGALAFVSRAK